MKRRPPVPPASPPPGWRPLDEAPRGAERPVPTAAATLTTPFSRLARTHALLSAGDTLVALALAGSLFFSISPDAARGRVALYLLLTVAPFAVVAPLIGPWMDRREGGRRSMVLVSAAGRAGICLLMIDDIDGLLLFPEAFAVLVLGKGYVVARASLVPGLVQHPDELVEANSKLTLISGLVGFAAAGPGLLLLQLGPGWVLALAAAVFGVGALSAFRIPRTRVAEQQPDEAERAELRAPAILLAASTMAVLRGLVGFLAFFLAFWLRSDDAPAWWFGVILAVSAVGALAGAGVAPVVRRSALEPRILLGATAGVAVTAFAVPFVGGRPSAALLAGIVGLAASAGKLAFDAIVQRDAPDANQGRSFARFETRFQLAWVAGAFLPVVVPIPLGVGYVVIGVVAAAAAVCYATGRQLTTDPLRAVANAGREQAARRLGPRLGRWRR